MQQPKKPQISIRCHRILLQMLLAFSLVIVFSSTQSFGRIYIDINAPSIQKFTIAIPEFNNRTPHNQKPEFSSKLSKVMANDLDLSGYFSLIEKQSFLVEQTGSLTPDNIRFKDWSVIGAELLLLCSYTAIGKKLEVDMRLYDVLSGRQVLGKRALGEDKDYRYLIHRLSNEIIIMLTGHPSIFLTKLAFISNGSGHKEIYMCDYDGHRLKQITRDKNIALLPRFSPDGKKIIYTSYKEGGNMLYLKDLVTGNIKRLSGKFGINSGGSWFPKNNKVALTMSHNGNPDIYLMNLDNKVTKRLTTYRGIDVSPSFSPDGKRIAFVSDRSGVPQIYLLDFLTGKETRLTYSGKYNTSPSWSSLNRIAFVSLVDGTLDIYALDPNGDRLTKLTENQGKNEDPCWSPDGRYIVFSSNRTGSYHLYIMTANGQNQKRITFMNGNHTSPTWAP